MPTIPCPLRWGWIPVGLLASLGMLAGCGPEKRVGPAVIANPHLGPMTVAVAPALNLSGAADFDPNRFADLMASELSYADGISVIPVSRVLGVLAVQGSSGVESPTHALELVELLGADAILVFAVTEYDSYDPPSIGISAQLYGTRLGPRHGAVDPVALSREARARSTAAQGASRRVLAQTQRVFDATHGVVVADIKEFARFRNAGGSPYGWRKYVVSQQDFVRYCCYATIRALLNETDKTTFVEDGRER